MEVAFENREVVALLAEGNEGKAVGIGGDANRQASIGEAFGDGGGNLEMAANFALVAVEPAGGMPRAARLSSRAARAPARSRDSRYASAGRAKSAAVVRPSGLPGAVAIPSSHRAKFTTMARRWPSARLNCARLYSPLWASLRWAPAACA